MIFHDSSCETGLISPLGVLVEVSFWPGVSGLGKRLAMMRLDLQ